MFIEKIDLANDHYAEIWHDDYVEQPYEDDDGVKIVILHRRHGDPSSGSCGSTPEDVLAWEQENSKEWYSIPLWMYDHSGIALSVGQTNPFSDDWDSGRVGILALKRSEWGMGNESDE